MIELDRPPRIRPPRILAVGRESFADTAAGLIADAIDSTPSLVLGVATGGTPEPVYAALAGYRADGLRTEGITLVALDEYVGLPPGSPHGYAHYVRTRIAEPLGLSPGNCHVPDGSAPDVDRAADDFEHRLAELGGVDLQIVGIGENGHLGFNEPGSPATSRTRVVELTAATRRANSRLFHGDLAVVPSHAITQGIATILSASRILLLARGATKAVAVHAAQLFGVGDAPQRRLAQQEQRVRIPWPQ